MEHQEHHPRQEHHREEDQRHNADDCVACLRGAAVLVVAEEARVVEAW